MVKNYLPNIPITIPGRTLIIIQEPPKPNVNSKRSPHKQISSNKMTPNRQHTMKNNNYTRKWGILMKENLANWRNSLGKEHQNAGIRMAIMPRYYSTRWILILSRRSISLSIILISSIRINSTRGSKPNEH